MNDKQTITERSPVTFTPTGRERPPEEPRVEPRALPCPFCGGPATVVKWHGGGPLKTCVSCEDENGLSCRVAPSAVANSFEEALDCWNTRKCEEGEEA